MFFTGNLEYTEGCHPAILQKLAETNMEQTAGYGEDEYCEQARELIRKACGDARVDVHFLVGGTQTNVTVISAALKHYQGVITAKTGRVVNIKKGQFLAPWDMKNVLKKAEEAGNHNIMLTERGASFGYNALVTDMRSLAIMRELGYPVVMDATHSVQIPGGQGTTSGGQSQYVPHMARAAAAVGIDALFLEVHDNPEEALSDGPNMVRLDKLEKLLTDVLAIDKIVRG